MSFNRPIDNAFGKEFIQGLRRWKDRMDQDASPLVDGTLTAGPFDDAALTVARATKFTEGWKTLQMLHFFTLLRRPQTILELGTNVGFSSAYLAGGQKAGGGGGVVHTIDASPYRERLARAIHEDLGLDNIRRHVGLFDDILPALVESLDSIDLAFIDGHHEYDATLRYFQLIAPKCSEGAVVFFDDVTNYSQDMQRAWQDLQADPRVFTFCEVGDIGMIVVSA